MTAMPAMRYCRPDNLADAVAVLHELHGEDVALLGGGTDLLVNLRQQQPGPITLVSVAGLPELRGIDQPGPDRLRIGAGVTLAELVKDETVRRLAPCLASTAGQVASPQIRQSATIGGNLLLDNRCLYYNQSERNRAVHSACFKADGEVCHLVKSATREDQPVCRARCCSDLTAVVALLDAQLHFSSPEGARQMAFADLHGGEGLAPFTRSDTEILTAIDIPLPAPQAMDYRKLRIRATLDFPALGVAVSLNPGANGNELGVAVVGVNTRPGWFHYVATDFADDGAMCAQACSDANAFAVTYAGGGFSRGYRKDMIAVFIRRSLAGLGMQSGLDPWT